MRNAQDNHLIDVCKSRKSLYVPLCKMHFSGHLRLTAECPADIAVCIFVDEQGTVPEDCNNFAHRSVGSKPDNGPVIQ